MVCAAGNCCMLYYLTVCVATHAAGSDESSSSTTPPPRPITPTREQQENDPFASEELVEELKDQTKLGSRGYACIVLLQCSTRSLHGSASAALTWLQGGVVCRPNRYILPCDRVPVQAARVVRDAGHAVHYSCKATPGIPCSPFLSFNAAVWRTQCPCRGSSSGLTLSSPWAAQYPRCLSLAPRTSWCVLALHPCHEEQKHQHGCPATRAGAWVPLLHAPLPAGGDGHVCLLQVRGHVAGPTSCQLH
jgi:hypothetical protein